MTSRELQGWYDDPFRLHEARYFSAGKPTKLVKDGDVESYDEPPSEDVLESGAAPSSGHTVSEPLNRTAPKTATDPNAFGHDVPPYVRRRPRASVYAAVAVVAVAGIVTAAVVAGKPRPAAAPVTAAMAYTATMNASSADVYTSYSITDSSHKLDVTASLSGPVSWSADQADLAGKTTTNGRLVASSRQIIDGKKTYSKTSIKGLPASTLAGFPNLAGWTETTWTGTSLQDGSSILASLFFGSLTNPAGMASPASMLGLLKAQASSVQNLGGEVLGGVNTTHYRALIPLSRLGAVTAADEAQAEQVLGSDSLGVDYWIDSAHLLRQLRLVITERQAPSDTPSSPGEVTIPLGTYPIAFSITFGLSHYGTPVHVVPPPAAQITNRVTCVVSADGFDCPSS